MARPRSCLARLQPSRPATENDLYAMRRAAWRKQGVAVLRPEDIRDPWTRQAVVNEATRLYGQRKEDDQ